MNVKKTAYSQRKHHSIINVPERPFINAKCMQDTGPARLIAKKHVKSPQAAAALAAAVMAAAAGNLKKKNTI